MSKPDAIDRRSPLTLNAVLRRAHLSVALITVLLVGVSFIIAGLVMLRMYINYNLELVARAASYTVEAALVFDDQGAAVDSLTLVVSRERVEKAEVLTADGQLFAGWMRSEPGPRFLAEQQLAKLILPAPVIRSIVHDGIPVGEIRLYGSGEDLLKFLSLSIAGAALCLALSGAGALYLSHRTRSEIVLPLQQLAQTAYTVRRERMFDKRVAPTAILELNRLGDDFNALLDEMESWQKQVELENASLAHQASHDPLTGVRNRAFFEAQLQRCLRSGLESGERVAVLFIDVDRFKAVNDELGHEAGDAVLCGIAARLKSSVRESDLVARLGGDEFAIVMKPLGEAKHAVALAENIRLRIAEPISLPSEEHLTASLSIGIAIFPDHAIDAASLLRSADAAMYKAKRHERGTYCVAGGGRDVQVRNGWRSP
ncbi:diguanylate cyclase [Paraburkholderia ginsengisoli]|uniref:Diguanylate cyclase n=1 Tax=Paraburkholderia ginsengisoli TaxID=311231 RepID=A0A7T4N8Q0_9BURK|nr:diguanylate cyclase [Paraburkholderia ginsengisoli]QQC67300.1 diguanylate cyclase [Paraburkholderia ginsengisoli]